MIWPCDENGMSNGRTRSGYLSGYHPKNKRRENRGELEMMFNMEVRGGRGEVVSLEDEETTRRCINTLKHKNW